MVLRRSAEAQKSEIQTVVPINRRLFYSLIFARNTAIYSCNYVSLFVVVEDHAKQMRIIFFERKQFLLGGFMFRFFLAFFERVGMRVRVVGVGGIKFMHACLSEVTFQSRIERSVCTKSQ